MFRDLRLAEPQLIDHVSDRPRSVTQQFDDLKPVRLGQGPQGCHHGGFEYASVRIFLSRHILVRGYIKPRPHVPGFYAFSGWETTGREEFHLSSELGTYQY